MYDGGDAVSRTVGTIVHSVLGAMQAGEFAAIRFPESDNMIGNDTVPDNNGAMCAAQQRKGLCRIGDSRSRLVSRREQRFSIDTNILIRADRF